MRRGREKSFIITSEHMHTSEHLHNLRDFILVMEWWQDNVDVSGGKHVNLYPLIFYYLRYIFPFIIKLQGASFYVSFTFLAEMSFELLSFEKS